MIKKVIKFLAGFQLASALLLILALLTFFGTLEQVEYGLHQTIHKYFTWQNFLVLPDIRINGKLVPLPLPGAYWVSALLFINMLLGGIIKLRKNWKKSGIFLSHLGILLLLLGGFITHHFSKRGNMALYEGETRDVAESYHDHVIEVSELDEAGMVKKVYVIGTDIIKALEKKTKKDPTKSIKVHLTEIDLQLEISHFLKNCRPKMTGPFAAGQTPSVDGFGLFAVEVDKADEANLNGAYAKTAEGQEFLLFTGVFYPYILDHKGKKYAITMRKKIWKMPFEMTLNDFNAEFFPSGKPKRFESYATRKEAGVSEKVKIYMNHPMRYKGYTFFQASYGPPDGSPDRRFYSVFEVVKNPSDQWPLYSIIVTSVGLIGHFGYMLTLFIIKQTKRKDTK